MRGRRSRSTAMVTREDVGGEFAKSVKVGQNTPCFQNYHSTIKRFQILPKLRCHIRSVLRCISFPGSHSIRVRGDPRQAAAQKSVPAPLQLVILTGNGKLRLILDMRHVHEYLVGTSFRMEGLRDL